MNNSDDNTTDESMRARKRRETHQRIMNTGISLFIKNGYEATTIDVIAAEAGISRRTFFYYFKSKDDILLSMQSSMGDMLAAIVRDAPRSKPPLNVVRDAAIKICATFSNQDMIAMDRVMRASKTVQARKQASYIQHEKTLLAALRQRWPEPERETALQLVAMLTIGAMRLSFDEFNRKNGKHPIAHLLRETFDALAAII